LHSIDASKICGNSEWLAVRVCHASAFCAQTLKVSILTNMIDVSGGGDMAQCHLGPSARVTEGVPINNTLSLTRQVGGERRTSSYRVAHRH